MSLPAVELDDGWSFTDLELDVIQHSDGSLVIEDEDEFADACRAGHINEADAAFAESACAHAVSMVELGREPFDQLGWCRLEELSRSNDKPEHLRLT